MRPVIFFHFRILSGFVGILAASAARRFFFVAEIGGKRGEFGGVWGRLGENWRRMAATAEKFIFLTGEGYRIYSSIYSASAEEKFLTGKGGI